MDEPIPGMDKRKSKAESLYLKKEKEWWEDEPEETRPQRGYSIRDDQPLFGQTPQALFRDSSIYYGAKALYGNLHTYKGEKSLKRRMFRSVTQEILARDFKVHKNTIARWLKILEKEGWITIIDGGWNRPNKIILHGIKNKKEDVNPTEVDSPWMVAWTHHPWWPKYTF